VLIKCLLYTYIAFKKVNMNTNFTSGSVLSDFLGSLQYIEVVQIEFEEIRAYMTLYKQLW